MQVVILVFCSYVVKWIKCDAIVVVVLGGCSL